MEKVVRKGNGRTRISEAIIPCDTTPNTSKTFDTPLVAKLGETVFYLNPEFKLLNDAGDVTLYVATENIIKGTVCKIDCATDCNTCITIKADTDGNGYDALQELFFRSFEEAAEVARKVNEYTDAHLIWKGDWYKIYKGLFQPTYSYTLKFPIAPQQLQKVWQRGGWHYIIPKRVVAFIEKDKVRIDYEGRDTKPEYFEGRLIIRPFKVYYSWEYKIVPRNTNN